MLEHGETVGYSDPSLGVRIGLDKDLDGWRPEDGQTDKYRQVIEDREYNDRDFDRNLILENRTKVVATRVTEFLRSTDRFAKTIIFCENIDHAERMRQAIVNATPRLWNARGNCQIVGRKVWLPRRTSQTRIRTLSGGCIGNAQRFQCGEINSGHHAQGRRNVWYYDRLLPEYEILLVQIAETRAKLKAQFMEALSR